MPTRIIAALILATLATTPTTQAQDAAAAQQGAASPATAGASVAGQSFLSPGIYEQLRPVEGNEHARRYFSGKPTLKPFRKVMFDPVQVIVAPGSEAKSLPPEVAKRMTDSVLQEFAQALEPAYQVVGSPGPDVIRVRVAVTNVHAVNPNRNLSDLIPVKLAFNLVRKATDTGPKALEMSGEVEILDPWGAVVGAAVATRKSEKNLIDRDQITWDDMRVLAAAWAKNLRNVLDVMRDVRQP